MGKAGRFACIFTPMALTVASLLCLIIVFMGQVKQGSSLSRDMYFFKADTSKFNANIMADFPDDPNTEIDNRLLEALQHAAKNAGVDTDQTDNIHGDGTWKDFVKVGLWNYCEGDIDNSTGKEIVTHCSAPKANFYFDPIAYWKLNSTVDGKVPEDIYPQEIRDGIEVYSKVAKWMFAAYVIAICLTVAELIVGIFAIFSRWGSLVTTIVSTVQTLFMIAAAATSTGVYGMFVGAFESVLKPFNIEASISNKMLSVVWLGVAFSIASGFFWLISTCCCSGKSSHGGKKTTAEKTPYTYERVASPYLGAREGAMPAHTVPASGHGTSGNAYEPFRHQSNV